MRTDERRIGDILDAIAKIENRMGHSADELSRDEMLQVWVLYHLQVIGEAARAVSESVKIRYPEVPWAQIIALRNILVHEYFGLNMDQVWTLIERDLPALAGNMRKIAAEIAPDAAG